ncbi:VOC family protein [Candidatus Formimonas warabiya]|uniref:VOC family protein n=1 Tax=Formimonas warabiya TaxID=1761012 RepID=UPI001F382111|nr:VOC family protein [Candidatus Formimonas warabiya]
MGHVTVLVKNYEEAVKYYTEVLGFELKSDTPFGNGMRWVTVAPPKQKELEIVFVEANTQSMSERVGNQAAEHVFLVLETDDCMKDFHTLKSRGVKFYGEPQEMPWGIEVVFEDLYGNIYDLLQVKSFE